MFDLDQACAQARVDLERGIALRAALASIAVAYRAGRLLQAAEYRLQVAQDEARANLFAAAGEFHGANWLLGRAFHNRLRAEMIARELQ